MKLYIDWNDLGFTLSDFKGMKNLLALVQLQIMPWNRVGDEIQIDRPTHSSAIEFFEITELGTDLIKLKHTGGIT